MMIDTKDTAAAPEGDQIGSTEQVAEPKPLAADKPQASTPDEDSAEAKPPRKPEPERYRHFKHLPARSHQWIEKNCGVWVLDAMRNYLLDPDRVFPDWGTRFAVTLKDIGREEVERMGEAEVLYDYVMTSPFWEINYQIRKRLMAGKPARKRGGRSKASSGKSSKEASKDSQPQPATPVKS